LYNRLSPNIVGFSRTNGYDINDFKSRKKIIEESYDADIFINNAQNKFGQTMMFLDLWEVWKNKREKTIINVGSRIADIKYLPPQSQNLIKYQAEKVLLKEMSSRVLSICRVKYVSFGYVGTEKILEKYPNMSPDNYISVDEAADIILNI
jgi:predicted solute-binding protein